MSDQGKNVITDAFAGTGQSATPVAVFGRASVTIEDGVGTVQIERSTDDGSNYFPISKNSNGDAASS